MRACGPSNPLRRRGFTLVEILVAVGIVALVAVGIAEIFGAVGETVTRGRQLGRFNQIAAQVERQMRADFEAMTRDGFLVIRQQHADRDMDGRIETDPRDGDYDGIEVDPEDARPLPRRVDEILFFRRGDFVSAREPIHPDLIARSGEAMVYYGHGRMAYDDGRELEEYRRPTVTADRSAQGSLLDRRFALGAAVDDGVTNPNQFAQDWTLLRKVVLLVEPGGSLRPSQALRDIETTLGLATNALEDGPIQIAGQPAASWPFRDPAAQFPENLPTALAREEVLYPELISGLVDIVAASLSTARRIVLDVSELPGDATEADLTPAGGDAYFATGNAARDTMRAWMLNALPADSLVLNTNSTGARVRFEPEPPDYFGVLASTDTSDVIDALDREIKRADQLALSASNFVPRCVEFIVEWSFGQTDTQGNTLWFGTPVDTTMPRDDVPDAMTAYAGGYEPYAARQDLQTRYPGIENYEVPRDLVYGPAAFANAGPRTATFGYVDPSAIFGDAVVPAAWPRLIRVTMTIADEINPSVRQTYQFVLEAPGTPDP